MPGAGPARRSTASTAAAKAGPSARHRGIRQAEEGDVARRIEPERRHRRPRLRLPQRRPAAPRGQARDPGCEPAPSLTTTTRAGAAGRGAGGEQATAAQAFIVRMRRQHQRAAGRPEQRVEIGRPAAGRAPPPAASRRPAWPGLAISGMPHRSPGAASAARISAAATAKARSGRRLAQIGGKVAADPLQRARPQEGGEPDRALRQFQHVQRRPLHRRPGEVRIGRGLGRGRLGLGPQRRRPRPRAAPSPPPSPPGRAVPPDAGRRRGRCGGDGRAARPAPPPARRTAPRRSARRRRRNPAAAGSRRAPRPPCRAPTPSAGEVDRAGGGGAHALGGPAGEVGALARRAAAPAAVAAAPRVSASARAVTSARAAKPAPEQRILRPPARHPRGSPAAARPAHRCSRRRRAAPPPRRAPPPGLRRGAMPLHQAQRVHMSLIQPAERQAGAADQAQRLGQSGAAPAASIPSPRHPAPRRSGARSSPAASQRGDEPAGKAPSTSSVAAAAAMPGSRRRRAARGRAWRRRAQPGG